MMEIRAGGAAMDSLLAAQRAAQAREGAPGLRIRRDRLSRAIALLADHHDALAAALGADFGHRSRHVSLLADIAASIGALKFARDHLDRWVRPERRRVQPAVLALFGARAWIEYVPKGVVGVMSPWNFPVNLTFAPLAGILAAGNRAMIKPSELTPQTSALMAKLIASAFDPTEITVVEGDAVTGAAFARLGFDHLLFTGSTAVGRAVAKAAAENLTPLTLELGGKSPVLLGDTADMALAARRIMAGKLMNAGQVCLSPDYALVPRARLGEFLAAAREAVAAMYPGMRDNPDYGAIINQRHFERLTNLVEDARARGVEIVSLQPPDEDWTQQPFRKFPPLLLVDPPDGALAMREEIFGPILPVRTYEGLDEALAVVNARPHPLALYYFGRDTAERRKVLDSTRSGGVTINDVVMHYAMEDLPFGGVGASGMGAYHGIEGFRAFSHARAIYRQPLLDLTGMLRPPFGAGLERMLRRALRR
jgi:coniferyl-aldehyde dehydrogenase